ncbi:hypothetical protein SIAM614_31668 [Stappia aggregata IAM 12614]|uniref:Uncharacterized protein n=1 Tax=Roseibium aggregatum (strain ATCC 25650 / DSM 13394 / JCM 20685 / NBRC 16684 / NCIMB 2208 / IAM 12614 / B1) TaxID=384765 RepID=A0P4D0_ROSAI|nr:hypothetical protein SIAM614_31668 [Stappia aggregata IAM 12614] [Roseibium aggregatum IAM 12614]
MFFCIMTNGDFWFFLLQKLLHSATYDPSSGYIVASCDIADLLISILVERYGQP